MLYSRLRTNILAPRMRRSLRRGASGCVLAAAIVSCAEAAAVGPSEVSVDSSGMHATLTATTMPLVGVGSGGKCLQAPSYSNVPLTIGACTGASGQQWTMPPAGTKGLFTLFTGAMCLDDYGGRGLVGDVIDIYTCVATAPNHQWTLNSSGQLVGINGLCVGVVGGRTDDGAPISLQTCNGSTSQQWSNGSTVVQPAPTAPVTTSLPAACSGIRYSRLVQVSSSAALSSALAGARAGDLILLADGTYRGEFRALVSGTAAQRISLCGGPSAIVDAGSQSVYDGVVLRGASNWTVAGFTITNALRAVMAERVTNDTIRGLTIHAIGQEGIHLRTFSSKNAVVANRIYDTGRGVAEYGEGIYIGTWNGAWCQYSSCQPDRSDSNLVAQNTLGPDVRAEHIEIKEGTTGGELRGNTFDGRGMVLSQSYVNSWVNVQGNAYLVRANKGVTTLRYGYKVERQLTGWGNRNTFTGNSATLSGSGAAFSIPSGTTGNVVRCDNQVTGAVLGIACIL